MFAFFGHFKNNVGLRREVTIQKTKTFAAERRLSKCYAELVKCRTTVTSLKDINQALCLQIEGYQEIQEELLGELNELRKK